MRSFVDLDKTFSNQPRELGVVLSRIDTGRGQERLYEDQAPELLRRLSEDARIESITASNAIEGVVVNQERAGRIAEGARFRNRNEREFAGYRDAVDMLMRVPSQEAPTVPFVLHLHRTLFQHTDGRGGHLKTDQNLIVSYETGSREVIFTPPAPAETEFSLTELLQRYADAQREGRAHPLVLVGALILDFLAIHPVADGNGRLARLLTTHELLGQSYGVVRYASIEQRVFETKNSYYAALYESQRCWHRGEHDIWPWVGYLVRTIGDAYDDFAQRVADSSEHKGGKQDRARNYILDEAPSEFRRREIERALPGISPATIRLALNDLRDKEKIKAEGSGPAARWRRL